MIVQSKISEKIRDLQLSLASSARGSVDGRIDHRTREIDLGERPQDRAVKGVEEGLSEVHGLRDFLKQALDRNLHLALD